MKSKGSVVGLFTLVILLVIFAGFSFVTPTSGGVSDVFISKIKNEVKVKRASSTSWEDAKKNMRLSEGDTIKTAKDSFATLKFCYPRGNKFKLNENTEVTIGEVVEGKKSWWGKRLKSVNINMLKGGTWAKLKGIKGKDFKFRLSTPNTVAAISGSSLATIVYSDDDTYFCACDGEIDVGTGMESVTIKRSQGTTVKGGAAPTSPIDDKYIITEKKYEKDQRYAWCINCHTALKKAKESGIGDSC